MPTATALGSRRLRRSVCTGATDIEVRTSSVDAIIASTGANPHGHADRAMRALIGETRRMTRVGSTHVRGAALVAGYGTAEVDRSVSRLVAESERKSG